MFSDYCRPAIRLAALMGQRVIHVMTHDSIGLGEDGPTHQPVEHLAALRAIPNLKVFRPSDVVETVECWQLALESKDGPSVLALTRQNLPQLRLGFDEHNRCAAGAYELIAADDDSDVVSLFATARLGAIFVPLNFRLTGPELNFIVNDAGVHTVVADDDHQRPLARLLVELSERGDHVRAK